MSAPRCTPASPRSRPAPAARSAPSDLAYRRRDVARARSLYARLVDMPTALGAGEVWRRLGELAEMAGDFEAAADDFRRAVVANPALVPAHEALARLALRRDD